MMKWLPISQYKIVEGFYINLVCFITFSHFVVKKQLLKWHLYFKNVINLGS